jgi:hypothetical protein
MQALTDNYTTFYPALPLVAEEQYKVDIKYINSSIIVALPKQNSINNRVHRLLEEYSFLKNNWDEEDAIAPTKNVIQKAKSITLLLERHGQQIFHAAPGPNGEIMLDIRNAKKTRSLEIIFYPTRDVVISFPEIGKPTQQAFEILNLPELLEWLNKR